MLDLYISAVNYCREFKKPVFLTVECFRWLEHVGVSEDWNLGYRKQSEITPWHDVDIILHPELVGLDIDFVKSKTDYYTNMFREKFKTFSAFPNPSFDDLLTNVY